jgi:protein-tyrosine phosphatase
VVPDKFVAFRGPKTLEDGAEYVDIGDTRIFSAHYYVDIFKDMGVTTVIRLNEPEYDSTIFTSAGIEHHDLEFEDCTAPSNHIVSRFLRIVDRAPGVIAVHCKAGLGRTGTLIALYAMLAHSFRARDIMGWLRIVRPGSVIGDQQQYLCSVEGRVSRITARPSTTLNTHQHTASCDADGEGCGRTASCEPFRRCRSCGATLDDPSPAPAVGSGGSSTSAALALQVSAALERRGAAAQSALKRVPS